MTEAELTQHILLWRAFDGEPRALVLLPSELAELGNLRTSFPIIPGHANAFLIEAQCTRRPIRGDRQPAWVKGQRYWYEIGNASYPHQVQRGELTTTCHSSHRSNRPPRRVSRGTASINPRSRKE